MLKPMFETSPDVRKLVEFLRERQRASYSEMSKLVNRVINGKDRYILYAAWRVLQREYDIVFVVERGIGIVRANNVQVAELSTDHATRKVGRVVRKAKKMQPIVNVQDLSPDQRDAFWVGRAVTQVLDIAVGRKMRSKIAEEIRDRGGDLVDVDQVVALFRKRAH